MFQLFDSKLVNIPDFISLFLCGPLCLLSGSLCNKKPRTDGVTQRWHRVTQRRFNYGLYCNSIYLSM